MILSPSVTLQNDLEEFFAMVNFTNPGILGDATYFRRHYEVSFIYSLVIFMICHYDLYLTFLTLFKSVSIFANISDA